MVNILCAPLCTYSVVYLCDNYKCFSKCNSCIYFQGPGTGTNTNQPPQPFFAPQGLPPGYPPPHFGHGSPIQPGVMGHVPPPAQQGKCLCFTR
jgi:hypothetical protein